MNFDFNRQAISQALRFYARSLAFPYDELTHELQHLFREIEKNIETDLDNTVASKILDIINSYQGEEMTALHAEYARMFSFVREEEPFIPIRLNELDPNLDQTKFMDQIVNSTNLFGVDDAHDAISNVLDLFSSYIEMEDEQAIEDFFMSFLINSIPNFCEQIYRGTILNFYKEVGKGLNELIYLLKE